jgi:hypothetical protein
MQYKMVIFPKKNAYKILVGRPEESLFVDLGIDGRIAKWMLQRQNKWHGLNSSK